MKNIMKNIISIKDLKPSKEVTPRTYTWLDIKYNKLPDVTGLTLKEAKQILKGYQVNINGTGDKVIYQEPEANTYIKENSTIKLMLN